MRHWEQFTMILPGGGARSMGCRWFDGNPEPGRGYGSAGMRRVVLTEPIELVKGIDRKVRYKASPDRPVEAWTELWPLHGRGD